MAAMALSSLSVIRELPQSSEHSPKIQSQRTSIRCIPMRVGFSASSPAGQCARLTFGYPTENGHFPSHQLAASWGLAGWTGLEPATSDVTGRRSNQLNYHPARVVGGEGFEPSTPGV